MRSNSLDSMRTLLEQRHREGGARVVPFISFVLTHLALTVFLVSTFFITDFTIKLLIVACGVLLIASEWIYTIVVSLKWKRDIAARLLAEEEQKQVKQDAQKTVYEAQINIERQRWQAEITRRRWQRQAKQQTS